MRLGIAALYGGQESVEERPFLEGPVFASTYRLKGDPDHATYQYGRFNNPTWSALEAAIGALEGGVTRIFPSGMAAVSAVLFSLLKPGDRLVLPSDGYFAVRSLARDLLSAWGGGAHRR